MLPSRTARAHADQALAVARELGLRVVEGRALTFLAAAEAAAGRPGAAAELGRRAAAIQRETGHRVGPVSRDAAPCNLPR